MDLKLLKGAMAKKKVNAEKLAVGAECSFSTARNMLAGRRVTFEIAYRTAKFLGLEVEKLAPELLPIGWTERDSLRTQTA